jgi:beta-galactosidase
LLGAKVAQWYAIPNNGPDATVPVSGVWGAATGKLWAEQLSALAPDTQVLMTYGNSNGWLDGQPAAVTRKVGKGTITYIGFALDTSTGAQAVKWMLAEAGIAAAMPVPDGVDLAIRSGGGKKIFILTNYAAGPRTITLPAAMQDILTGTTAATIELPQYGVAVLQ